MKGFIKEYFNYSKREFKGLVVLVALILIVFIWPIFAKYFKSDKVTDFELFKSQISQFETQANKKNVSEVLVSYFVFDPNTVGVADLLKLGLLNSQAQTLINYRNAGGKFEKPTDLMKIYTIDEILYKKLEPYIAIEQTRKPLVVKIHSKTSINTDNREPIVYEKIKLIELNSADSIDLIKLYGVGSVLSRRIINYRHHLGGYVNIRQLLEVYGIDIETYGLIESSIVVDTINVIKIDINNANFKTLNSHPYISYTNTKSILKYRELMGKFASVNELVENHLIDSLTYNKVKYYIKVK